MTLHVCIIGVNNLVLSTSKFYSVTRTVLNFNVRWQKQYFEASISADKNSGLKDAFGHTTRLIEHIGYIR